MKRIIFIIFFFSLIESLFGQWDFIRCRRSPDITFSVYSGIYMPSQSASVLGNHLLVGVGYGKLFNKNLLEISFDSKFGKAKDSYEVLYDDSIISTNSYHGSYLGIEYSRTIFSKKKSYYYITSGIGLDRMIAKHKDIGIVKGFWSPNFSLGFGYRYRLNANNNLSFQLRYQYLNFDNTSGTELSGNSFTVRIIWLYELVAKY